ncbi:MAG: hypothetical protein KDC10_05250 [Calditrichaeota bacterium]|nr:hypothetical protein [Candidatus Cloacimonadota bacterium]MCB1046589.1 hypothetical protein [Calditrichota bacterium]
MARISQPATSMASTGLLVGMGLMCCATQLLAAAPDVTFKESVAKENAHKAVISIEVGAAQLHLMAADQSTLAELEILHNGERTPRVSYRVEDGIGTCEINNSNGDSGNSWNLFGNRNVNDEDQWTVSLCRDLPIDLQVNFGMGSGDVDLGGMDLSHLEFMTGLSDVVLDFSKPCKGSLENAELATGLGKMEVRSLGNAPFGTLDFSGGLGSAVLDFSGKLRRDMTVNLDVGMGSLTLRIPEDFGIKVRHEDNFFSKSEFSGLEKVSEDTWYSDNWQEAKGNLTFVLSVGMGSVKLERIP